MSGRRVLLTNNTLDARAGTETYLLDVARGLRRRGHEPIAYSTSLGAVATQLRTEAVEVTDDLGSLARPPDVIHGQHHVETMTALLRFPGVPAIYVCHGARPWQEEPPLFPRIYRYVAVDDACRDRCLAASVPAHRLCVVLNFVDLDRFRPRGPPLPAHPRRALLLSNYATESTHLPAVRDACEEAGIALDVRGVGVGRPADAPEEILRDYDLVFAKGRAALEAMAVGAAVVLCDADGSGPLLGVAEFDALRPLNFGFRTLTRPVDAPTLLAEIHRYDPVETAALSKHVREVASVEPAIDALLSLYEDAIAEHRATPPDPAAEAAAASRYVRSLGDLLKRAASELGWRAEQRRKRQKSGRLARWLGR